MSNSRGKAKSEQKNFMGQMQDFSNNSMNFFNKCAKPDRKGKIDSLINH